MSHSTDSIIRVVGTGGGVMLDAGRMSTDALVRIASAAAKSGGMVIMKNLGTNSTDSLCRIGSAGKGHVILDIN